MSITPHALIQRWHKHLKRKVVESRYKAKLNRFLRLVRMTEGQSVLLSGNWSELSDAHALIELHGQRFHVTIKSGMKLNDFAPPITVQLQSFASLHHAIPVIWIPSYSALEFDELDAIAIVNCRANDLLAFLRGDYAGYKVPSY